MSANSRKLSALEQKIHQSALAADDQVRLFLLSSLAPSLTLLRTDPHDGQRRDLGR